MCEDIAFSFCINQSTVSRIFKSFWMSDTHLMKWPDRNTLRETINILQQHTLLISMFADKDKQQLVQIKLYEYAAR